MNDETTTVAAEGRIGLAVNALAMAGASLDMLRKVEQAAMDLVAERDAARAAVLSARTAEATAIERANAASERANEQAGLATRAVRDLREFKHAVREAAIQAYRDENWCLDGLNAALSGLGLDEYRPVTEFTVTVQETAMREGTITVEVDRQDYPSEESAMTRARELAYQKWEDDSPEIDWDAWDDHEAKDSDDWEVSD